MYVFKMPRSAPRVNIMFIEKGTEEVLDKQEYICANFFLNRLAGQR